jgi:hypothetical protein
MQSHHLGRNIVSEKQDTSIFRAEEKTKQEISTKQELVDSHCVKT